jgi:hypothetical protein
MLPKVTKASTFFNANFANLQHEPYSHSFIGKDYHKTAPLGNLRGHDTDRITSICFPWPKVAKASEEAGIVV